jgi:hypothetical protein
MSERGTKSGCMPHSDPVTTRDNTGKALNVRMKKLTTKHKAPPIKAALNLTTFI